MILDHFISPLGLAIAVVSLLTTSYMLYIRYHRYDYLNSLIEKYPNPNIVLEDYNVAFEIYSNLLNREFPFSNKIALSMVFIKTISIKSISDMLLRKSETLDNSAYRLEKTGLNLYDVIEPYARIQNRIMQGQPPNEKQVAEQFRRQEKSIQRINKTHSKYKISNDEYLYVLYAFATEIVRWVDLCEWRKLDIREINAVFKVWYEIGILLGIKDIPSTYQQWKDNMEDYGEKNAEYVPRSREGVIASMEYFTGVLSLPIKTLTNILFPCALKDYERISFGIRKPSFLKRALFGTVLLLRRLTLRYFYLPKELYTLNIPFDFDMEEKIASINPHKNTNISEKSSTKKKPKIEDFVPQCPHFASFSKDIKI